MGCVGSAAVMFGPVEIQLLTHSKAQSGFERAILMLHGSQGHWEAHHDTGLGTGFQSLVRAFFWPSSKLPKVTGEEAIEEPSPPVPCGL